MKYITKSRWEDELFKHVKSIPDLADKLEVSVPTARKMLAEPERFFLHHDKICKVTKMNEIQMAKLIFFK